jgi:hypothetical protein
MGSPRRRRARLSRHQRRRLGKYLSVRLRQAYSRDGLGKALEGVDDGDRHVLDATVFQLLHAVRSESGALVPLKPKPEDFLAAVGACPARRAPPCVEPREPALVFGDQPRIETGPPIARRQLDPPGIGDDRLPAIAISPVARLLAGEMMIHLGVANPFPSAFFGSSSRPSGSKAILGRRRPAADRGRHQEYEVPCVAASSASCAPIRPNPSRNPRRSRSRSRPGPARDGSPSTGSAGREAAERQAPEQPAKAGFALRRVCKGVQVWLAAPISLG